MSKTDLLEQLETFKHLQADWDSYDGSAIDHQCVEKAKAFLQSLPDDLAEPQVFPCAHGGVNICWSLALVEVDVDIRCDLPEGAEFELESWKDTSLDDEDEEHTGLSAAETLKHLTRNLGSS